MFRLRLIVTPSYRKRAIGVISRRLHAYVLQSIQKLSPQLSQSLHDRKERQAFSIYPLLKKGEIWINTPYREVISCLQQHFLQQSQIDLIDWQGDIKEVHCRLFTESMIDEKFSSNFTLHFLTPTTFYQWGNYYPLPELKRLFSSASKAYGMCKGKMIAWEDIEPLMHQIRVEHLSVTTKRVSFGEFNVIGFQGSLVLNTKALPKENQNLIWQLVSYGSLMGFGYKTAWGLGQTLLDPLEDIQSFFPTTGSFEKHPEGVRKR